jgi:biotin carboxyl carrier protein
LSLYYVTIGKNEYNVNLEGNRAKVNGKLVSGDLKPVNKSGLHVLQRGKKFIELFLKSKEGDNLEVLIGNQRVLARVETSQRRANHHTASNDLGVLSAPMPGILISVLVKVGEEVQQGQTLVVLESMKMQMQLRPVAPGIVQSISVKAGDQVEKGAEIIRIK